VAPPRVHPTPNTQIVGLLAECRRRGYSFEEAWWITVLGSGRAVRANDPSPPPLAVARD
jgi:hypothetical protein